MNGKPDYSDLNYWAAHPWKFDPSDRVPKPLRKDHSPDSTVDVFFIHPTTLTKNSDSSWNAAIDDGEINKKTDNSSILYQASVFNEKSRVFSPRYRQAHLRAFYIPEPGSKQYFDIAFSDIKNSFDYYLEHFNNGRPVIIAAHSQGTLHAGRLLKEYFEGKPLQHKLVCAYIIGLPIPEDYFSVLKPCKDATSTGCFVGWRTFKKNYVPPFVQNEPFNAIVINPLTWTMDEMPTAAINNSGGILKNFDKVIPHVVSAQVHKNILWTSKPNFFGKFLLRTKNYHAGDINLFYMNIRENVKARINAFWKN